MPKTPDVQAAACPSRLVLEHVTSRWGVLALAALLERTHRFSELRRRVGGVSEKMLAQTLQTLERDGFVHREAYPVIPPRVEYSLTALGEEAAHQVWALARWSERRVPEVLAARDQYDTRRQGTARADTNSASASSVGVASGGRASVGINLAGTSSAGTSSVATSSADTSPVG
nr:helix-turn-helix domain-containing protein [Streptomyces zagrosensis]